MAPTVTSNGARCDEQWRQWRRAMALGVISNGTINDEQWRHLATCAGMMVGGIQWGRGLSKTRSELVNNNLASCSSDKYKGEWDGIQGFKSVCRVYEARISRTSCRNVMLA